MKRNPYSTNEDIQAAVSKANSAKEAWRLLGVEKRIVLLKRLFEDLKTHKEDLSLLETKEMGMPITQSQFDVEFGLEYFDWYLRNAEAHLAPEVIFQDSKAIHTVFYEPIGTSAVISSWNFPFSNFIWGVIPNLVVGNTVVFKHAQECLLFGKKIQDLVAGCSLPEGVFSAIHGGPKVGDYLVHQDIDLICFTGSSLVGQHLYKVASKKFIRVVLELGGSAPGILFEDADVEGAIESIYNNRFLNSGQVCDGLKRLLVHKDRFQEVVQRLKNCIESKSIGSPEDKTTDIGPLVSKKQLTKIEKQVGDAVTRGATVITGGEYPNEKLRLKGNFYSPTILTGVTRDMKVWQEEVFGPVLPVVAFSTEEEAISLANDTVYGLGGYIFTRDNEKAKRVADRLKTGMVAINNATYVMPCNPFGGYKKSGIGREHGKYGLREICQIKIISMET